MQQHPPNCDCRHWQRSPGVSKSPQLRARETALNAVLEVVHHSASALGQKEECSPWPSAAPGVAMFHLTPFNPPRKTEADPQKPSFTAVQAWGGLRGIRRRLRISKHQNSVLALSPFLGSLRHQRTCQM